MDELIPAVSTGLSAFTATNIDDLVLLTLFFSQVTESFRRSHIVLGQYVGFMALVLISLTGFLGGLMLPAHWIGRLGLIPIALGLNQLVNPESAEDTELLKVTDHDPPALLQSILSPQTYGVAAITIANGSDNVGIYVPLFASSGWQQLLVVLTVFMLLVGVWCYVSDRLTHQPMIATAITRYGGSLMPFVLIALGIYIVLEHQALHPLALIASSLCILGLVKKTPSAAALANSTEHG